MEDAKVIFQNDFRWSSKLITLKDFLSHLEGQPIYLPASKTTYAKDIYLEKDTPILQLSVLKSFNAFNSNVIVNGILTKHSFSNAVEIFYRIYVRTPRRN